ncbi:phage tail protein [Roseovarius aestuariivivens]|nr:phage tail protein [Roseovarius aestuariivivens]
MTWTLHNAFSVKILGTDQKVEDSVVAVESIDLAYEGITVTNGT